MTLTPEVGALRRVEPIMGSVVSIDVRPPLVPMGVLDDVFDQLRDVEARFSTYRPDSEISRLGRGEVREEDSSPDVRHVLAVCDHLARATRGAFDASCRVDRGDGALPGARRLTGVSRCRCRTTDIGRRDPAWHCVRCT